MTEGGLDIALLVVLGYFVLRGVFLGVVKEVVSVMGVFVAFWVASIYWPMGDQHLKAIFDVPSQRGVTSFILIFAIVYFLLSIVSIFVDKIIKLTIGPLASGLLGAVAGAIKGFLVCGILMAGAETFLRADEKLFTNSTIWPYLKPVTEQAIAWMPESLRSIINVSRLPTPLSTLLDTKDDDDMTVPLPGMNSVDLKTIRHILDTQPEAVTKAWQDKLRNITDGTGLTLAERKRFISDHPDLFASPKPNKTGDQSGTAPSWPQPAQ